MTICDFCKKNEAEFVISIQLWSDLERDISFDSEKDVCRPCFPVLEQKMADTLMEVFIREIFPFAPKENINENPTS